MVPWGKVVADDPVERERGHGLHGAHSGGRLGASVAPDPRAGPMRLHSRRFGARGGDEGVVDEPEGGPGTEPDPLFGAGIRHVGARTDRRDLALGHARVWTVARRVPSLLAFAARVSWRADRWAFGCAVVAELAQGLVIAVG